MLRSSITVTYNGPALDDHTMDIKDLAPSVLALSELFELANNELNNGKAKTSLRIVGFESNCVTIPITIDQSVIEGFLNLIQNKETLSPLVLATMLGFSDQVGLLQLLLWVKGREITKTAEKSNGKVELFIKDESLEIGSVLWGLFKNVKIRRSIEKFSAPVRDNPDIDNVTVKTEKNAPVIIDKEAAKKLIAPILEEEILKDSTDMVILEVRTINWGAGSKWRFSRGAGGTFWASILDPDFNERKKNRQELFGEGDLLEVDLRTVQYMSPEGLKERQEVIKVHRKLPLKQTQLNILESEKNVDQ